MIKKDNKGKGRKELSNRRTSVLMGSIFSNETFSPKIFLLFLLFFFSFNFISADYSNCDIYGNCKPVTSGTTTYNNTYQNITNQYYNATVNDTQFSSNNPITILESWLRAIITGYNYLTSSYNSTYDTFAYNQTTTSLNWSSITSIPFWINNVSYTSGGTNETCTNEEVITTGATITNYTNETGVYMIYTFTTNGTFNFTGSGNAEILVVGGGGGGGYLGGGGGAGGISYSDSYGISTGNYDVIVGSGGGGGVDWYTAGENGGDSSFGTLTGTGGGGGGSNSPAIGSNGGCGGGEASHGGGASSGGTGSQGGNGGGGINYASPYPSGGGGGMGANGGTGTGSVSGGGGIGVEYSINGSSVYYAGGGSGGWRGGSGGSGTAPDLGGGGAGTGDDTTGEAGTDGLGSGGGGGGYISAGATGGKGGSGVVIIKYLFSETVCINVTTNNTLDFGDTVLLAKGFNVHSELFTGNALDLISNIKADTKAKTDAQGFTKINHKTIGGAMEIRNGQVTQSLDKTLAILIKANQQLIEKVNTQSTQIKELQNTIETLTGKDLDLTKVNDIQDEAICSIKIFDWCVKK